MQRGDTEGIPWGIGSRQRADSERTTTGHCGDSMGTLRGHHGGTFGTLRGNTGDMLGSYTPCTPSSGVHRENKDRTARGQ